MEDELNSSPTLKYLEFPFLLFIITIILAISVFIWLMCIVVGCMFTSGFGYTFACMESIGYEKGSIDSRLPVVKPRV